MEQKKNIHAEKMLAKRGEARVSKRAPERTKAIARRKELSPLALIASAVREHLPMETIERLAALHEKALAAQAKNEFFDALTELQAELPPIIKTKKVMNRKDKREEYGDVRFAYAPIEVIVYKVKGLLKQHGFSYTFKPARSQVAGEERWLEVPCILHHVGGHEETSTFPSPIMNAEERKILGMSQAQAVNAAQTFGRRCSFIAAVGIMTADPDNDGANTGTDGEEGSGGVRSVEEAQAGKKAASSGENLDAVFEDVTKLVETKANGPSQMRFIETAQKHYDARRVDLLIALRDSLRKMK